MLVIFGNCLFLLGIVSNAFGDSEIVVTTLEHKAPLKHFWESTGLCPPLPHQNASQYLLSEDMKQNLLLVSSVPHSGIKQVRIHWLLDLITVKDGHYDFNKLDQLVFFFYKNGLHLGFEIMGNPSNVFSNFDNVTQVTQFKNLVSTIANRYIVMHGIDYVAKWNFETWNEPDNQDFDDVKISVEGFLKYYDACYEGLFEAHPALTFGGPGGSCRTTEHSKRCYALLEHCANGRNFITGKFGTPIDFISIHQKGNGLADNIINGELNTFDTIFSMYPSLSSTPVFNDEADPLVGWNKPEWWRADVTYAAIITKVIVQHQTRIIANKSRSNIKYALLSNDNGFLSFAPNFFTQRTLNARFQINNTNPRYVHFVKKPALVVMGLLAKLGDVQVDLNLNSNSQETIDGIAAICTSCKTMEVSTLLYNSNDTFPGQGSVKVSLTYNNFSDLQPKPLNIKAITCELSNKYTNPYAVWKSFGSPVFPTAAQLDKLHEVEGPHCSDPVDVILDQQGVYHSNVILPLPGVTLQQICWKPNDFPDGPTQLQIHHIQANQVLIVWSDANISSKCIKTYIVQYTVVNQKNFKTINKVNTIFTSFTFIASEQIKGFFRVKAVDFWKRESPFSNTVWYS